MIEIATEYKTGIIYVTYGTGEGRTNLAAFDAALWDAGIANHNLIKITSIIPDHTQVICRRIDFNEINYGHKLYVVLAECQEASPGKEAWAGLGWILASPHGGPGLFVESCGSEGHAVVCEIRETLKDMSSYRAEHFGTVANKIVSIKCSDKPVCAVVAAVYKMEGW
jgi:arginine decarboxylase